MEELSGVIWLCRESSADRSFSSNMPVGSGLEMSSRVLFTSGVSDLRYCG